MIVAGQCFIDQHVAAKHTSKQADIWNGVKNTARLRVWRDRKQRKEKHSVGVIPGHTAGKCAAILIFYSAFLLVSWYLREAPWTCVIINVHPPHPPEMSCVPLVLREQGWWSRAGSPGEQVLSFPAPRVSSQDLPQESLVKGANAFSHCLWHLQIFSLMAMFYPNRALLRSALHFLFTERIHSP